MSFSDINLIPEEERNEPMPDLDKQPSFESKLVIHRSKPVPHPGDGNRQPASIFRRKTASPQAANLPIALNLEIPVQATVPITLQVPVNILLNQTQLHASFTGLQNTIRPYYCSFDKNAQYPQGIYICQDHDAPTSTPGVP
jgi:hypothetical protein